MLPSLLDHHVNGRAFTITIALTAVYVHHTWVVSLLHTWIIENHVQREPWLNS